MKRNKQGNLEHKLSPEYIIYLAEKLKKRADKKKFVFTDIMDGKLVQRLFDPKYKLHAVSCTIPKHSEKKDSPGISGGNLTLCVPTFVQKLIVENGGKKK